MRKVVYTVITNDYDKPKEFAKQKGWEYLCFTDNVRNFKSKTWQPVKTIHPQRFIKLTSHRVNAEWSLYIDGSITIEGDLDRLLYQNKDNDFNIVKHRTRSTLNEEAKKCVQLGKADPLKIQNQVNQYYKDGFKPFDNKMVESGIMLRKGTFENKVFGFLWWQELQRHTHRDQLSFNYVAWKNEFNYNEIINPYGEFFSISRHNR